MSVTNAQLQALLDLTVSSSTNGAAIQIPYGTIMCSGNVIFCPGLSETTTTIYNTSSHAWVAYYSYSATMAVGFCEGPAAITKIWGDTSILYDNTGSYIDYEGEFVNTTMYSVGAIVSYDVLGGRLFELIRPWYSLPFPAPSFNTFIDGFYLNPWQLYTGSIQVAGGQQYPSPVLYTGTDDQDIDPTIATGVSANGTRAIGFAGLGDLTSAFRGLTYAVWVNLDLTNFSNRIPSIRAVVMSNPSAAAATYSISKTAITSNVAAVICDGTLPTDLIGTEFTFQNVTNATALNAQTLVVGMEDALGQGISNVAISGDVLTLSVGGDFTPYIGAVLDLGGLTTATFLNGESITIATVPTGTTLTAAYTHADYASHADTGTATMPQQLLFPFTSANVPVATSTGTAQVVPYSTNVGLDNIVTDICQRCGIDTSLVDAADLATIATTEADTYQTDGSGIPALTMLQGGMVHCYQGAGTGAPWKFSYPGTDNNYPLPSPKLTWQLPNDASINFNPYPADDTYVSNTAPDGEHYWSFLQGWTNTSAYNLQPMTLAGVVSGGGLGAASYDGNSWQPFTPTNVGEWHEANWNMVVSCTLNVAVAGTYTFKVSANSACIIGMGNGATRVQNPDGSWGPMLFSTAYGAPSHLSKTALNGLPIVMAKNVDMGVYNNIGGINPHTGLPYLNTELSTFTVSLPAGLVSMEVDYGCHVNGRVMCINWMIGTPAEIEAGTAVQSPLLPVVGSAGASPVVQPFGFLISDQKDGKSLISTLQDAYLFDLAESDFKMKFVQRGAHQSVMQIPESDLGLVADKKKIIETVVQEQDAPKTVIVNYLDTTPGLDYQQGSQQKMRSSRVVTTLNQKTLDLTDLAISGDEARAIAEKTLFEDWMERSPYEFNLSSPFYSVLDPTDVVQFAFENVVYQERLKTVGVGQNYAVKTTGVSQLPQAYASVIVGAPVSPVIVTVYNWLEQDDGSFFLQEDGSHFLISV